MFRCKGKKHEIKYSTIKGNSASSKRFQEMLSFEYITGQTSKYNSGNTVTPKDFLIVTK